MGVLTLLSLPIGNLDDLTVRVSRALQEGRYFAVEDTRTFKTLLHHLGISLENKKIFSYFEHSTEKSEELLLQLLAEGETLYLCSEAGNPLISDPAYPLVSKALQQEHELQTYPGVSALLVGLDLSGLPPYPLHFYGFFPREKEKGQTLLQKISEQEGTHAFFEAPARAISTLEILTKNFPQCQFSVGRELTKKFESVYRFMGADFAKVKDEIVSKGEFTLFFHIGRKDQRKMMKTSLVEELAMQILEEGTHPKMVSKLLAEILGRSTKEIYYELTRKEEE